MEKWSVDRGEFRIAENKLKTMRKNIEDRWNTQAWIHQSEMNKRLMSLVEQLKKSLGELENKEKEQK